MATDLVVFEQALVAHRPQMEDVLAGRMPATRLERTLIMSCQKVPKLLNCSLQSLLSASMTHAVLGLEVDGVTGQGFILPFGSVAQPVIGYKGYNTIAARSKLTITGGVVYEGDAFDLDKGEGKVSHKPSLEAASLNRRMIGAWSKAAAYDRPPIVEWLSLADLMAVKAKSPGARKDDSPWNDPKIGFPAMCEKTVKRRLARSTPMEWARPEFHYAAAMEEAFEERGRHAYIEPGEGKGAPAKVIDAAFEDLGTKGPSMESITKPKDSDLLIEAKAKARLGRDVVGPWFESLDKPKRLELASHLPMLRKLAANPQKYFEDEGREAAEGGAEVLATWWASLTPDDRNMLDAFKTNVLDVMVGDDAAR